MQQKNTSMFWNIEELVLYLKQWNEIQKTQLHAALIPYVSGRFQ